MKRTLSLLLALIMVVTMVPAVFAETSDDPDIEFDEMLGTTAELAEDAVVNEEYTTRWDTHYYALAVEEAGKLQFTTAVTVNGDAVAVDGTYDVEAGKTYTVVVTGKDTVWSAEYAADEFTTNKNDAEYPTFYLGAGDTEASATSTYDEHYYTVVAKQGANRWTLKTTGENVDVVVMNGDTVMADTKQNLTTFQCKNNTVYTVIVTGAGTEWTIRKTPLRYTATTLMMENKIQVRCTFQYNGAEAPTACGLLVFNSKEDAETLDESLAVEKIETDLEDVVVNSDGTRTFYGFSKGIPANEMANNKFYLGYVQAGDTVDYSISREFGVQGYLVDTLNGSAASTQLRNLCHAIAQYGAAAQVFVDGATEGLLNDNAVFQPVDYVSEILTDAIDASWDAYENHGEIIRRKASTLKMEGAIEYQHRVGFKSSADPTGKTISVEYEYVDDTGVKQEGEAVLTAAEGFADQYLANVSTIIPEDLDNKVTFRIYYTENDVKTLGTTLEYGALSYLKNTIASAESAGNDALKNVCEAIATYIYAVDAHFKNERANG